VPWWASRRVGGSPPLSDLGCGPRCCVGAVKAWVHDLRFALFALLWMDALRFFWAGRRGRAAEASTPRAAGGRSRGVLGAPHRGDVGTRRVASRDVDGDLCGRRGWARPSATRRAGRVAETRRVRPPRGPRSPPIGARGTSAVGDTWCHARQPVGSGVMPRRTWCPPRRQGDRVPLIALLCP